jgi:hypothetical protein
LFRDIFIGKVYIRKISGGSRTPPLRSVIAITQENKIAEDVKTGSADILIQ